MGRFVHPMSGCLRQNIGEVGWIVYRETPTADAGQRAKLESGRRHATRTRRLIALTSGLVPTPC